jgi:hypothetical protein
MRRRATSVDSWCSSAPIHSSIHPTDIHTHTHTHTHSPVGSYVLFSYIHTYRSPFFLSFLVDILIHAFLSVIITLYFYFLSHHACICSKRIISYLCFVSVCVPYLYPHCFFLSLFPRCCGLFPSCKRAECSRDHICFQILSHFECTYFADDNLRFSLLSNHLCSPRPSVSHAQ